MKSPFEKSPFDIAKKYLENTASSAALAPVPKGTSTDPTEGPIVAVQICSNVLGAHIWLAFDDHFNPGDGQAVFYADELPFFKHKDSQTLKEIHKVKLVFPGCRVIQEGVEVKS